MSAIDDLTAVVASAIAVMDSADALIAHPVVAESTDPQVQALADQLKAHVDQLSAHVPTAVPTV